VVITPVSPQLPPLCATEPLPSPADGTDDPGDESVDESEEEEVPSEFVVDEAAAACGTRAAVNPTATTTAPTPAT
jgi:hypothetical protein